MDTVLLSYIIDTVLLSYIMDTVFLSYIMDTVLLSYIMDTVLLSYITNKGTPIKRVYHIIYCYQAYFVGAGLLVYFMV